MVVPAPVPAAPAATQARVVGVAAAVGGHVCGASGTGEASPCASAAASAPVRHTAVVAAPEAESTEVTEQTTETGPQTKATAGPSTVVAPVVVGAPVGEPAAVVAAEPAAATAETAVVGGPKSRAAVPGTGRGCVGAAGRRAGSHIEVAAAAAAVGTNMQL